MRRIPRLLLAGVIFSRNEGNRAMENAKYYVRPLEKGLRFEVEVPGSKSITNRALLLAALSKRKTIYEGLYLAKILAYL